MRDVHPSELQRFYAVRQVFYRELYAQYILAFIVASGTPKGKVRVENEGPIFVLLRDRIDRVGAGLHSLISNKDRLVEGDLSGLVGTGTPYFAVGQ